MPEVIQPKGWPRPRGSANGMVAAGRLLAIGGQVGARPSGGWLARGLPAQFAQAIDNVLTVVSAAGGKPGDIVAMTLYVTDVPQYQAASREIGELWRERFGSHYPAMTLVEVKGLLDPEALIEMQGLAVLPG